MNSEGAAAMDPAPTSSSPDQALRFVVFDEEDLAVMSTHLQDAHLAAGDVIHIPAARRFALVVSRVDRHGLAFGRQQRRQAGFHFDHVTKVRHIGFGQRDAATTFQLLAVSFNPTDRPAGHVLLTFAGGRMIKLEVACLEAEMRDLSPCWAVRDCPRHQLEDEAVPAQ